VKNQYFGDINDYSKYGLLRAFGASLEIAVIWMLTADDGSGHGNRTQYLESGTIGHHDPELFAWLTNWYRAGARHNVALIEQSGLLPNCRFFNEIVPDESSARAAWFDRVREFAHGSDLVFLDPDNGLPGQSRKPGAKSSSKYVRWEEVGTLYEDGHSLLIYQHFARVERRPFINGKLREIYKRFGIDNVITFGSFDWVALLLAADSPHSVSIDEAARRITIDWHQRIHVARNVIVPMEEVEVEAGALKREARIASLARKRSTDVGYVNRNDQEVVERTERAGTDHGQRVYIILCRRCRRRYGANGSDIWLRKCPHCQDGKPGL
jgi:hypothetical protein